MADEAIAIADMSSDQAKAAIAERRADVEFMTAHNRVYSNEGSDRVAHQAAVDKMTALYQVAYAPPARKLPSKDEVMSSLRVQWGGGVEEKLDLAKKTAVALGGDELKDALAESEVGNDPAVIRKFVELGLANERMPVIRALRDALQLFPDAASARDEIERREADPVFIKAYLDTTGHHPQHKQAVAELTVLYQIANDETVLGEPQIPNGETLSDEPPAVGMVVTTDPPPNQAA